MIVELAQAERLWSRLCKAAFYFGDLLRVSRSPL
jgi:hypothetical protein